MENEAMETIEMLYSMVSEARRMPLAADKVIIERDGMLSMLEELRDSLPVQIAEAKRLLAAKEEFIANAKREADSILLKAEERAKALCSNEEVVKQANQKANEILSQASMKTKEMKKATSEFADNLLRTTEETLLNALNGVKTTRQTIRTQK